MENFNKILNKKQMEEIFADYAFGRTSPEQSIDFEKSLEFYPELAEELQNVRRVFDKIDTMNFDRELEYRTRNLSYKVIRKLEKKNQKKTAIINWKYLAPIAAMMLIVYFVFNPGNKIVRNNYKIETSSQVYQSNGKQKSDKQEIKMSDNKGNISDLTSKTIMIPVKKPKQNVPNEKLYQRKYLDITLLDEIITEHLIADVENFNGLKYLLENNPDEVIFDINEINDNDLQTILTELENAEV